MPKRHFRTGKVRYHTTPKVEKINTEHKYKGGKHKFLITNEQSKVSQFDNYNNADRYQRLELISALKYETLLKNQMKDIRKRNSTDTNHKKWHRNHPKDGFYNSRQVFD
ncbi:predicted protein [Naegleria gruberi]|uniref:Predicted protein n=1 Tax=Naegleria gruberi TaxID=5762 RepID=D2W0Z4_NAEGR|nr:uncharacterized protein NAEGRDRAFT_75033 [Naegleria gruberi]EFC37266.1 predicted protein [Naegleria gruberi]|eukprot:XP_002670010.1 predicted protein [Naegleria gruberi strain NEG-M]